MKKQLKFVTGATKATLASGEHYVEAQIKYPIYIEESELGTTVDEEHDIKPNTFDPEDDGDN